MIEPLLKERARIIRWWTKKPHTSSLFVLMKAATGGMECKNRENPSRRKVDEWGRRAHSSWADWLHIGSYAAPLRPVECIFIFGPQPTDGRAREKRSGMQESHPAHCYPAPRRNEGEESEAKTVREGRETRIILHAPLACSSESKLVRRWSSKRFMKAKHENKQIKKKILKWEKHRECVRDQEEI